MKFETPLREGIFLKRYKRFFADIDWQGKIITAHVANTGSLKTCAETNSLCLFTESADPKRKLKYGLEMIRSSSGAWVGVNTSRPNALVKAALQEKMLEHWKGWDEIQPEFKISPETRLDFRLRAFNSEKFHYIEVKNVTMVRGRVAQFPDAVTTRGQKHLREMIKLVSAGQSAEIVFIIQREDCDVFSPADDIDPEYGQLLREAINQGVRVTPLKAILGPREIELSRNTVELKL